MRRSTMGPAAIFFERTRMADQGHGFALDGADAAERIALEDAIGRSGFDIPLVAVRQERARRHGEPRGNQAVLARPPPALP